MTLKVTNIAVIFVCFICIVACSNKVEFPNNLVGKWRFDIQTARAAINKSIISDDQKEILEKSYFPIVKDQTMEISSQGEFSMSDKPDSVKLRLHVLKVNKNSYIIKTINSLNPDMPQYSEFIVENDSLKVVLLGDDLKPIKGVPDDYWERI
jgi:hypothetical protein